MTNRQAEVLLLQHQQDGGPGNLAVWLDQQQIPTTVIDVTAGLPEPGRYRAIAVLGSRESVFDKSIPWISAEREFVEACMEAGTPVLGLCFGAQLLATLQGGQVRRTSAPVRGWIEVNGAVPFGGRWFGWHQDHIVPTQNMDIVASTDSYVYAFTVGPHVGVQFHPEIQPALIQDWLLQPIRQAMVAASGGSVDAMRDETAIASGPAQVAAFALYGHFFGANQNDAEPIQSGASFGGRKTAIATQEQGKFS